jgi:colicin import membrane protein
VKFKSFEMKTGLTISAIVHLALLLWGVISFAARPLEAKPTDALPVDIISAKEFSQMTAGVKNAPKVETPKPVVDKVGEQKPAEELKPKVEPKPEIKSAAAEPPPAADEPKPVEAKPEKKPPPKPKVDPIAEALKKEEQRKAAEAKARAAEQKKLQQQPKFDPNQIAALLDKRDQRREVATGEQVNTAPSLGMRSGSAPALSQSELDAMRAKLMQLWNPPAGVRNPEELIVKVRISLKRDGTLADWPIVLATGRGEQGAVARESAVRAIIRGQPFTMLSPATYDLWKEIDITFDPRDMFRG